MGGAVAGDTDERKYGENRSSKDDPDEAIMALVGGDNNFWNGVVLFLNTGLSVVPHSV